MKICVLLRENIDEDYVILLMIWQLLGDYEREDKRYHIIPIAP